MADPGAPMSDSHGGNAAHPKLAHAKEAVVHELRQYLVVAAYLWLLLFVIALVQDDVLKGAHMQLIRQGFVLVNALVLGKVMLIAVDLQLGAKVKSQPLIWPILFDALILSILFIVVKVLEEGIKGMIDGKRFMDSLPLIGGGGVEGVLAAALIGFVATIPFFAVVHLERALGPGKLQSLLFDKSEG
jgi:hypothetical protein